MKATLAAVAVLAACAGACPPPAAAGGGPAAGDAVDPPAAASASASAFTRDFRTTAADRPAACDHSGSTPAAASSEGFADLEFVHENVTPNGEFLMRTFMVSPDSIAANILHLQDYGTRYATTSQVLSAGKWLLKRLWGFGYEDTLLQAVSIDGKVSIAPRNVIASKPGLTRPEFRILIGGHYDSIARGGGVPATESAPGADDNASGTAGALEVARLLADVDLDATVEFVFFTAEELGLLGSQEYVNELTRKEVPTDKLFFINMDMIGNSDTTPWQTRIYYNMQSEPLAGLIARIGETYSATEPVMAGGTGRSDHSSFWGSGYSAVFLHEMSFSPHYHTTDDLLENLEMDYEAEVIKMALATILHLGRIVEPPTDVTAEWTGAGETLVKWTHSLDADLLGYYAEVIDRSGGLISRTFTRKDSVVIDGESLAEGYRVRVRPVDVLGEGDASASVLIGTGRNLTAVASPNPTASGCRFDVFIPGSGGAVDVTLRIVDASGRRVAESRGGPMARGSGSLRWSGRFSGGGRVPAGVYFYVVEAAGVGRSGGKIIVLR